MSEFEPYQFGQFMAIDEPLDDEQLAFMRGLPKCAKISRRVYAYEYRHDDDIKYYEEMLCHGYDVHLYYANHGVRRLSFHLPTGLPCEPKEFEAFLPKNGVTWRADPSPPAPRPKGSKVSGSPLPYIGGKGRAAGILEICPESDLATYEKEIKPAPLLRKIAPVRAMLMRGDLRPLYLAWLACAEEPLLEPPVPAGLGELTTPLRAMARFFEVDQHLIAAAAEQSPALPKTAGRQRGDARLAQPSQEELRKLLEKIRAGDRQGRPRAPPRLSKKGMQDFSEMLRGEIDITAVREVLIRGMNEFGLRSLAVGRTDADLGPVARGGRAGKRPPTHGPTGPNGRGRRHDKSMLGLRSWVLGLGADKKRRAAIVALA